MFVYQKALIPTCNTSFSTINLVVFVNFTTLKHKLDFFCNQKPVLYAGFKISDIHANTNQTQIFTSEFN